MHLNQKSVENDEYIRPLKTSRSVFFHQVVILYIKEYDVINNKPTNLFQKRLIFLEI